VLGGSVCVRVCLRPYSGHVHTGRNRVRMCAHRGVCVNVCVSVCVCAQGFQKS